MANGGMAADETASDIANNSLECERTGSEILPLQPKQMTLHYSVGEDCPERRLALCLRLQELVHVFDIPLEGVPLQAYDVSKHRKKILEEANSANVIKALKSADEKFAVHRSDAEPRDGGSLLVNIFREALTGLPDEERLIRAFFLNWQEQWASTHGPGPKELWQELAQVSEFMRMQASALNWSSDAMGVVDSLRKQQDHDFGNATESEMAGTKRCIAGLERYVFSLTCIVDSTTEEPAIEDIADAQSKLEVASRSLLELRNSLEIKKVTILQRRLESERERTHAAEKDSASKKKKKRKHEYAEEDSIKTLLDKLRHNQERIQMIHSSLAERIASIQEIEDLLSHYSAERVNGLKAFLKPDLDCGRS